MMLENYLHGLSGAINNDAESRDDIEQTDEQWGKSTEQLFISRENWRILDIAM